MRYIVKALTIGSLMVLFSCSGSWYLNQAREKSPELFKDTTIVTVNRDTLSVEKKVFELGQVRDSIIYLTQYDTVTQDLIKIQYVWKTETNTVEIEVDCPDLVNTETIIEKKTTVIVKENLIKKAYKFLGGWKGVSVIILAISTLVGLKKFFGKK